MDEYGTNKGRSWEPLPTFALKSQKEKEKKKKTTEIFFKSLYREFNNATYMVKFIIYSKVSTLSQNLIPLQLNYKLLDSIKTCLVLLLAMILSFDGLERAHTKEWYNMAHM